MVCQCIPGLKDQTCGCDHETFVYSTINMWVYSINYEKKVIYCIYSNSCYHEKI